MTDPVLVGRKLALLREHLERVRRRRPDDLETFRSDVDRQDALALSLLVVVQEAIDIAFHFASDEGWGVAASYREGFELLARHGVIDAGLATELAAATSLRNRIAHGYASVDVGRLWAELPAGIAAFERFVRAIATRLAGSP